MRPWTLIALSICAPMISNCAGLPRSLPDAPQIEMPAEALRPCALSRLPEQPSQSDIDIAYAQRGADLVACDGARRLAVQTHAAEHLLEAQSAYPAKHWRAARP